MKKNDLVLVGLITLMIGGFIFFTSCDSLNDNSTVGSLPERSLREMELLRDSVLQERAHLRPVTVRISLFVSEDDLYTVYSRESLGIPGVKRVDELNFHNAYLTRHELHQQSGYLRFLSFELDPLHFSSRESLVKTLNPNLAVVSLDIDRHEPGNTLPPPPNPSMWYKSVQGRDPSELQTFILQIEKKGNAPTIKLRLNLPDGVTLHFLQDLTPDSFSLYLAQKDESSLFCTKEHERLNMLLDLDIYHRYFIIGVESNSVDSSIIMQYLATSPLVAMVSDNDSAAELANPRWVIPNNIWNFNQQQRFRNAQINLTAFSWRNLLRTDYFSNRIAIIDTGIDEFHPEWWGWSGVRLFDFSYSYDVLQGVVPLVLEDNLGHGTGVASVINVSGNQMLGIVWNALLVSVKAYEYGITTSPAHFIHALQYITGFPIPIANASLVWENISNTQRQMMTNAILTYPGFLISAAGNSGGIIGPGWLARSPADIPADNHLSVGALTTTNTVLSTSNVGANVKIFAPGDKIVGVKSTTVPHLWLPTCTIGNLSNPLYHGFGETSFAAPFVAGMVSILRLQNRTMSNLELKTRVLERSTPFTVIRSNQTFHVRRLNADNITQ